MPIKLDVKDILKDVEQYKSQEVLVQGWVRSNRDSKSIGFLQINDGTHFESIQVVYEDSLENYQDIAKITIASGIEAIGELLHTPDAQQPCEIKASKINIIAEADSKYPIQKKRHTFEYLRTIAHLRPRANTFSAVFRVRSVAAQAFHEFFASKDFTYVHTPIITSSDCEGAGEMFQVTCMDLDGLGKSGKEPDYSKDFFSKPVYLTVSGQLNVEPFATAFKNVYTFGPTFRAENSNTSRHMSEFWMIEPEIAFADLQDDMNLAEEMIKFVTKRVMERCSSEIKFFGERIFKGLQERLETLVNSEYKRMTYTEAVELLKKADVDFENPVEWGLDLKTEHERYISEKVIGGPVFLTDYPKDIKSFYMKLNEDGKTVAACDLLVPGVGELVGGSQREDKIDTLLMMMEEKGLDKENYQWYLDNLRYGGVHHAGFGIGFDRYVMYVTGMENIRDVIPYPRVPKLCDF
ncbi:MAG: asparagine--tRNA ligase [Bacillota bacterium]|nr:asparagine--tRNA ligase [Bacillota bacterium]